MYFDFLENLRPKRPLIDSSPFFCNLEKHNFTSKLIPKLEKQNGEIISDQFQILNEAKLFYEELYTSKDEQLTDINLNTLLANTDTKKLNVQESNTIEGFLTYEEAGLTLKAMQNNRSPGSDGFSAEFFLKYSGKTWVILLFGQSIMALKKGNYQ